MWLRAPQEQSSRGQHPQRAQALPSPWCHQLLLAGSLVPTGEPWPGSMCPVLAACGASLPHPLCLVGSGAGAEALGRAAAGSELSSVQKVPAHRRGAACRAAGPCASPHLPTSAPRVQRKRRVCRNRIRHILSILREALSVRLLKAAGGWSGRQAWSQGCSRRSWAESPDAGWVLRQAVLPGAVKGLDSGGRSRGGEHSVQVAGQGRAVVWAGGTSEPGQQPVPTKECSRLSASCFPNTAVGS